MLFIQEHYGDNSVVCPPTIKVLDIRRLADWMMNTIDLQVIGKI